MKIKLSADVVYRQVLLRCKYLIEQGEIIEKEKTWWDQVSIMSKRNLQQCAIMDSIEKLVVFRNMLSITLKDDVEISDTEWLLIFGDV